MGVVAYSGHASSNIPSCNSLVWVILRSGKPLAWGLEKQVVYKKAGHEVVSFVIWSCSSKMSGGLVGGSFPFVSSSAGSSATLTVSSAVVSEFLSEVGLYSNLVSRENSNFGAICTFKLGEASPRSAASF